MAPWSDKDRGVLLRRSLRLVAALAARGNRGMSLADIDELLGCGRRTTWRWVGSLEEIGVAYKFYEDRVTRVRLLTLWPRGD